MEVGAVDGQEWWGIVYHPLLGYVEAYDRGN